jgi:hypothetical protein
MVTTPRAYDPAMTTPARHDDPTFAAEVSPAINQLGNAFYFAPATLARGKELTLGGLRFYFVGRGGMLGDVEWPVVASAFGYFNPAVVEQIWTTSQERVQPKEIGRAYVECSREFGRAHFADVPGLEEFCAAAESVVAEAGPAGLPLYAGLLAMPLASDAAARAYQLVTLLREHRGSVHLLAVVAVGLEPRVAHAIRRPNDLELFGWTPEDIPPFGDAERRLLDDAEAITDRLVERAFSVLDDEGRAALRAGLSGMQAALA